MIPMAIDPTAVKTPLVNLIWNKKTNNPIMKRELYLKNKTWSLPIKKVHDKPINTMAATKGVFCFPVSRGNISAIIK